MHQIVLFLHMRCSTITFPNLGTKNISSYPHESGNGGANAPDGIKSRIL